MTSTTFVLVGRQDSKYNQQTPRQGIKVARVSNINMPGVRLMVSLFGLGCLYPFLHLYLHFYLDLYLSVKTHFYIPMDIDLHIHIYIDI